MAGEPPQKKAADIFSKFASNEKKMSNLKAAYNAFSSGVGGICLRTMRITQTDACMSRSFSHTCCEAEGQPPNFTIGDVFTSGMQVLELYLKGCTPVDKKMKMALLKLLDYIFPEKAPDELSSAVFGAAEINDAGLALRMAQHLLTKLAVSRGYTLDHHFEHKAKDSLLCPCSSNEPLVGVFGDTSFGCPEAWHGSSDIIIENVPISVMSEEDNQDQDETVDSSGIGDSDLDQLRAQAIVFSFLQKKQCSHLKHCLVPSIGISKKKIIIHLYDCENDVLLSTGKLDLFAKTNEQEVTLNYYAIILLWLTLNYKMFCSGLPEEMKERKSSFFSLLGDGITLYEKTVRRPCGHAATGSEDESWVWSPVVRCRPNIEDITHEPFK